MRELLEPRLHAPAPQERTLRRVMVTAHRRRDRIWRRLTRRSLRLLLLVSALGAFGGWLLTSPVFALRDFTVEGESRVPRPWIDGALADWRGANLLLLDLHEVEARLRGHRWIRAVALHKRLPDRLAVEVHEHRPVALLVLPERTHYVSDEGLLIAPADEASERLPTLRVDDVAAPRLLRPDLGPNAAGVAALRGALESAAALRESALHWAGEATEVVLVSDEDYRITLRDLAFPVVVRPDTPPDRIEAFARVLPALERELGALRSADLRFTRRIVVQPRPPDDPARESAARSTTSSTSIPDSE
ncbi:MAG TPA: FtsQ-type POTRA domain-containing protein [Thermoanaerobaculia bacterium]|nr:FtsQ-type POTRA domain-containing protein [Thermoanaerobaculia bacterium]